MGGNARDIETRLTNAQTTAPETVPSLVNELFRTNPQLAGQVASDLHNRLAAGGVSNQDQIDLNGLIAQVDIYTPARYGQPGTRAQDSIVGGLLGSALGPLGTVLGAGAGAALGDDPTRPTDAAAQVVRLKPGTKDNPNDTGGNLIETYGGNRGDNTNVGASAGYHTQSGDGTGLVTGVNTTDAAGNNVQWTVPPGASPNVLTDGKGNFRFNSTLDSDGNYYYQSLPNTTAPWTKIDHTTGQASQAAPPDSVRPKPQDQPAPAAPAPAGPPSPGTHTVAA